MKLKLYLSLSLLIIAALLFSFTWKKKLTYCKDYHKGEFYSNPVNFSKKYKLIRDDSYQLNITIGTTDTSINKIKWLDDCTYTLDYISGGGSKPSNLTHHTVCGFIVKTADDYCVTRISLDSVTSKVIRMDTIWTKPQ